MESRANGPGAPISHERVNAHQQRELRKLGLLANPAACNAEVAHQMENLLEYALVARMEHRSDGAQEDKMEILLDCALATSNSGSEHRVDEEVIAIPNTLKEVMESRQAAKGKETICKEMASLDKHEVFDLVSPASVPSEKVIGTQWVFKVKADHTQKARVVVRGWDKSRQSTAVAPALRHDAFRASVWHSPLLRTKAGKYFKSMFRQRF